MEAKDPELSMHIDSTLKLNEGQQEQTDSLMPNLAGSPTTISDSPMSSPSSPAMILSPTTQILQQMLKLFISTRLFMLTKMQRPPLLQQTQIMGIVRIICPTTH